jgi:chromatin assembly factor 1 subunit B
MEVNNLTIVWHDNNEPVYSVHFQPNLDGTSSHRLATGGGDNNVRIWRLNKENDSVSVEYLSTLARHTQAVNAVRFDPKGEILATAGDDGTVLIWTLSKTIVKEFGQEEDDDIQESWTLRHSCRSSTSEIYDLAWSPDSKFVITGSTDNVSRIYDVSTGQQVHQLAEHNHYVQGVAWDPLGQFVATQSADRSIHIYSLNTSKDTVGMSPKIHHRISRAELPTKTFKAPAPVETETAVNLDEEEALTAETMSTTTTITNIPSPSSLRSPARSPSPLPTIRAQIPPLLNYNSTKNSMLYHTENLESFFRRLSFSPDGNFLFTPSGIFKNIIENSTTAGETNEELTNTVYIYSRTGLSKPPIGHLPGFKKPALVVSFSPIFYQLDSIDHNKKSVFELPYKMVYAVATQDSVFIYDTQHETALGSVSSIHYRILTDISWNSNGDSLIVSSADGFCTLIRFKDGELGVKLDCDYKSLLPGFKTDSTKMESPLIKKRANDDYKQNTPKKGKIDSITSAFLKPVPVMQNLEKNTTESMGREVVDINDEADNKDSTVIHEPAENKTVVNNPLVKQKKKRISPTLLTSTSTNDSQSKE